jgi:hypothetical protein
VEKRKKIHLIQFIRRTANKGSITKINEKAERDIDEPKKPIFNDSEETPEKETPKKERIIELKKSNEELTIKTEVQDESKNKIAGIKSI